MNFRYEKLKYKEVKVSAGIQLAGIAIAILRIGFRSLPLFKVVWFRNRNICELFRLNI